VIDVVDSLTERLAQLLVSLRGINELYLAATSFLFVVGQNPTVGGNAGIVEDIVWELDNGIDKVILQQIAADVALGLSGIACKER
jgi:hypothetical protein